MTGWKYFSAFCSAQTTGSHYHNEGERDTETRIEIHRDRFRERQTYRETETGREGV